MCVLVDFSMEKARLIISSFLKIEPSEVDDETKMGSSALGGSLILLRMYSTLAKSGYNVKSPIGILTYGDFRKALNPDVVNSLSNQSEIINQFNDTDIHTSANGIGIDIEDVSKLPNVRNFSADRFYIDNFSTYEIEYCVAKKNPLESFAAIFSLKEAIVKADNSFLEKKFNQINIMHTSEGKPAFKNFILSTSHTNNLVVSVAINQRNTNKISSLLDDKHKKMPDVKKYSVVDEANYFTRTQTVFIFIFITLPIYVIFYLNTIM